MGRPRRCGCCGAEECTHDPREPWSQVIWTSKTRAPMVDDICGGCRVRPLMDIIIACEARHEDRVKFWKERLTREAKS